jgi:pyrroline-5-carboxylate reductase
MKVGFAGAGNMAAAMARGWAGAEGGPDGMLFCDSGSGRAAALAAEVGGEARETVAELGRDSDLVVLAVKPKGLDAVAAGLAGEAPLVVSVLAGTPLEALREALGETPVIRTMPNVAVEARAGLICHAPTDRVPEEPAGEALALLALLGTVVEVDEGLFDPVTALVGCAPAFLAVVAEALTEAGVREGIGSGLAHELVVEALAGTAALLRERDTLAVRRAVTSPGGGTAAGLAALEAAGVRAAFGDAVRAVVERMRG